jgi:hypothetical protein
MSAKNVPRAAPVLGPALAHAQPLEVGADAPFGRGATQTPFWLHSAG